MIPELPQIVDFVFRNTLGKLKYFRTFAPGIEIIANSEQTIREILGRELGSFSGRNVPPSFLDIGARDGDKAHYATGFEYHALDVNPRSDGVVAGDICKCPQLADDSYDVVFSLDVFEHLQRPWDAAKECVRITKPNGLMIHRTLFSYRYHPEPLDYWRFSSQCLEYLFTDSQQASTILKGYDIRGRRRDRRGIYLDHRPPIDWLGGFRENWQVLWIGRKNPGSTVAALEPGSVLPDASHASHDPG